MTSKLDKYIFAIQHEINTQMDLVETYITNRENKNAEKCLYAVGCMTKILESIVKIENGN